MNSAYAGGPPSRRGWVTLYRLKTRLPFESVVEQNLLLLLDASPEVVGITRSELVEVYKADGTLFSYTPDFDVTLGSGQVYTIECKPAALLPGIFKGQEAEWMAKASVLTQQGRPLRIVTDLNCPSTRLDQVKTFNSFAWAEVSSDVRARCLGLLRQQGATRLSELRRYLRTALPQWTELVDSTLYALLAQHELFADVNTPLPDCLIDVPGAGVPMPPVPLGLPLEAAMNSESQIMVLPDVQPGLSAAHRRYKESPTGLKKLRLFALYNDPSLPLTDELVNELAQQAGVSTRTVFRFREALMQAGGPGLTFDQLIPCLTRMGHGKPRRTVQPEVQGIIEKHAHDFYFVSLNDRKRVRVPNIAHLVEVIRKACLSQELPPPTYVTVKRYVQQIEQRNPVQYTRLRYGQEAAQRLEARQGRLMIHRTGELLGIDCTPCDVFILPDESWSFQTHRSGRGKAQGNGKARRCNLVTVVDVATSQVLRSELFQGPISAASILQVLRNVFLGETDSLKAAGVTTYPEVRGLPKAIRVDGGTEFVNRQVSRVLGQLGISVLPRNKGTRHHGGIEERTIGTLSHGHHILPGTSMNNIANRGDYDAQRGALMSFVDLNAFHQRFVERHNSLCPPYSECSRPQHLTLRQKWRPERSLA